MSIVGHPARGRFAALAVLVLLLAALWAGSGCRMSGGCSCLGSVDVDVRTGARAKSRSFFLPCNSWINPLICAQKACRLGHIALE